MANYIVSYDLNGPNPTHSAMDKHMEKAGWTRARILETVWYVGTTDTQKQVMDHVTSILSKDDQLIVVTGRSATWRNLLVTDESLLAAWSSNAPTG